MLSTAAVVHGATALHVSVRVTEPAATSNTPGVYSAFSVEELGLKEPSPPPLSHVLADEFVVAPARTFVLPAQIVSSRPASAVGGAWTCLQAIGGAHPACPDAHRARKLRPKLAQAFCWPTKINSKSEESGSKNAGN